MTGSICAVLFGGKKACVSVCWLRTAGKIGKPGLLIEVPGDKPLTHVLMIAEHIFHFFLLTGRPGGPNITKAFRHNEVRYRFELAKF